MIGDIPYLKKQERKKQKSQHRAFNPPIQGEALKGLIIYQVINISVEHVVMYRH